MNDFFVSYAIPDQHKARDLVDQLTTLGGKVAFDERDIKGGDDWVRATQDLLARSRICVVVLSSNTSKASVQPREVYLAQYLQSRNPDWYRIVPVFLDDHAASPGAIEGLDTVSAYFEKDGGLKAVAGKLMATLNHSGDRADSVLRSVSRLDEIARVWLHDGRRFGGRFALDGGDIVLHQRGHELQRIRRDEFGKKLSAAQRRHADHIEQKMEALYEAWRQQDRQVLSDSAQARADEFAARLGSVVKDLLGLLMHEGFRLEDHYEHIRSVVESYERRQGLPN